MRNAIATLIEFVICMMVPVVWIAALAFFAFMPMALFIIFYMGVCFGCIPLAFKGLEITYNWGRK